MNRRVLFTGVIIAGITSAFVTEKMAKGVDISAMDKKANPRDDFYEFANGNWCKENPVPATEARWTSFNILTEKNNKLLKKILEDAANDKTAPEGSIRKKIGDFYRTAMDTIHVEAAGAGSVLKDIYRRVDAINDKNELFEFIANCHKKGIHAFFNFDVSQDIKINDKYICYLAQGGLGLPDRDYYFKEDEKSEKIRVEYRKYIMKMFSFYERESRPEFADVVMRIESELARSSMTRVERRDMEKQYNKFRLREVVARHPNIKFDLYFNTLNIPSDEQRDVIVAQPEFFMRLNQMFEIENIDNLHIYLKWKIINATTSYLSDEISRTSFDFYGTVLNGTKKQKSRWERVVAASNSLIGEMVAQEYVKVAFSPESKKRINEMVDNLSVAFKERITKLDWMSESTKIKALEKLKSFTRKLGYPDNWKDFGQLKITNESYVKNYFNASEFAFNQMTEKLNRPVDKTEWEMLPQTVNAYYNPVNNEIVFPAAIMQPPFFSAEADDAVNYGAIGAVIGHEFSHGFDDQGSKYDATGNMNNWWSDDDKKKFEERTKILVDQYNKFSVEEKVFVNGQLTLGENIADLAGLTISYDAYQHSLIGKSRKSIDGFTPEQRFFIGFAQVWRNNARPEYSRQQVMTDPHSPGKFRVYGPLSNMPQFYEAFGVKAGDKMYREEKDRAKIW